MAPAHRDLSSTELWHESLERSQRRRELSELARKHQSRQKSASLAVTAAMATTPIAPSLSAFKGKGPKRVTASAQNLQLEQKENGGKRVLLERGMSNSAVAQVQEELKVPVDGIFGPVTELAVEQFQKRKKIPVTGAVDVRTWLKLFPDGMVVFDPSKETAQLAAHVPNGAVPGVLGSAGGPGAPGGFATAAGGPSSNLLPANGVAESDDDARVARLQAARGGAPEGVEADGGILPDRDAPTKSRDRKGDRDGGSKSSRRSRSRNLTEGVTVDRSPGSSSGSSSGSRGGSSGSGSANSGRVGGPVNVSGDLGSKDEMIGAMIAAANRIDRARYPYRWGGGHNASFSGPYDCSGAVSAVLRAAGLLNRPMVSGEFMRWGRPGPGAVTIYANAGHMYMSINGRFFGTSRANPAGGAGWFNGSRRAGYVVVHVPFESMKFKKSTKKAKATTRTKTRAANSTRQPATQAEANRNAQSGGSAAPSSNGTAQQQAPAEQQPAQQQPAPAAAEPAPAQQAPAQQAAPAQAAPAPAPEAAPAAPAPAPAPEATAPVAPEAAPAAPAAPETTAPAAPEAAPAPEAPAAPEATAPAPAEPAAPAAPAASAPAEPAAPAPEAPAAPEASAPAEAAPAASEATAPAGTATEATTGEDEEDSAEESGSTPAAGQ